MRNYADLLAVRQVDSVHIPIGAYHEPHLLDETDSQELLFFTTLAPFKGLELLLEAFLILRTDYPCLKLIIAGSEHARFPNYPDELRTNFNGSHGIQWLGQIAEDHVMDLFRRAQIVVLPYTASTGSSSVLYQAATWGRPVVASDLPEIQALIMEGNLLVEIFKSGDVVGLCNALRALLDSPEKRRAQAKHNFNSIQHARPESTCKKYIEVFNYALKKHGSVNRIQIPSGKMETE